MSREDIVNSFIEWLKKTNKKSYYSIATVKNLLAWDDNFFNNKLFNIKSEDVNVFAQEVRDLVYTNTHKEWKKLNKNISNGAPQAILGDKNYIEFLRTALTKNLEQKDYEIPHRNYFSFNTNKASIADNAPTGMEEFEFEGIYHHKEKININDIVFFVQRGDQVPWNKGLSAICEITALPFDTGYNKSKPKHFKIKIKPLLILPTILNRDSFVGYFDIYDLTFVGPMTKNEPNQANALLTLEQAQYLVGALIDYFPQLTDNLKHIFGSKFPVKTIRANVSSHIDRKIHIVPNPIYDEPKNLIIYGAPGTGKSYLLQERINKYFTDDYLFTRITFHSNYSYRNFVGSYKPKPIYKEGEKQLYKSDLTTLIEHKKEPLIEYAFEPGPFLIMLQKALENPEHNFVIIIEELNRANAASVFGDVFQLLDRSATGESEYAITLEVAAMDYLKSIGIIESEIKIPANLYLWATMNNADQGVMPLDSAFKRRWQFEHISLNKNQNVRRDFSLKLNINGQELKWNQFRSSMNRELLALGMLEDKLIGPFFLTDGELSDAGAIKNKLLLYLKEDVLRYKSGIFKSDLKTFSQISEKYDNGENIFDDNINWFE